MESTLNKELVALKSQNIAAVNIGWVAGNQLYTVCDEAKTLTGTAAEHNCKCIGGLSNA